MISKTRVISLARCAILNYIFRKPLCVSFEITRSCNAKCQHCHLGGSVDEDRASPELFGEICRNLSPVVAQISGGEPMLRNDLEDIIKALHRSNRAPYIDITTNGSILTKKKFDKLIQAGIDQVLISLDYPDNRHDAFRGIPGLFSRIENLIKEIGNEKAKLITLLCVVHRHNFKDLVKMVELANDWQVKISFSAYTWLRTGNKDYLLTTPEMDEFRHVVSKLIKLKMKYNNIYTSQYVFNQAIHFFENHSIPKCQAGVKFLVVNPDGTISPCGLVIKDYKTQKELRKKFLAYNSCTSCYTSIRANTEKPIHILLNDSIKLYKYYRL